MIRFVLVALLFAVAVYLLVRIIERRSGRTVRRRPQAPQNRRSVAPDDDEQFLRDLDKKRKDEPPTPG